jgi:hypothetical protein
MRGSGWGESGFFKIVFLLDLTGWVQSTLATYATSADNWVPPVSFRINS